MHREQNYGCEEVPEVEPPPPMDHDVMTSTKAHDHTYEWLDDRVHGACAGLVLADHFLCTTGSGAW